MKKPVKWEYLTTDEKVNIKRLYSAFEEYFPKNFEAHGEMHNFWECVYVKSGKICVLADDATCLLKTGDIIFHQPMEYHKFLSVSPKGAELFIFSFSFEGSMENQMKKKFFTLNAEQKNIIEEMLDFCKNRQKGITVPKDFPGHLAFLYPFNESFVTADILATYIKRLILLLSENGICEKVFKTADIILFNKAVDYMNDNISSQITVSQLAKRCNVSDSVIKRAFAKNSGIGVHKYFLTLKIKRAAEMLKNNTSISDVAEKLGFSSKENFSATFKRETGKSPSAFKNQ